MSLDCDCFCPDKESKCHYFIFNPNVHDMSCAHNNNTFIFYGNYERDSSMYTIELMYDSEHKEYKDDVHEYISKINLHKGYGMIKSRNVVQYNFADKNTRNMLSEILFHVKHKSVLVEDYSHKLIEFIEQIDMEDENIDDILEDIDIVGEMYEKLTPELVTKICYDNVTKYVSFYLLINKSVESKCQCCYITKNQYSCTSYEISTDTFESFGEYIEKMSGFNELVFSSNRGNYKVYCVSAAGINDNIREPFTELSRRYVE